MLQWNIESQYHNLNDIICDFAIKALCLYTQMFQAHQSMGVRVQGIPQCNSQLGFSINEACECSLSAVSTDGTVGFFRL